jgi:hypothetical protein
MSDWKTSLSSHAVNPQEAHFRLPSSQQPWTFLIGARSLALLLLLGFFGGVLCVRLSQDQKASAAPADKDTTSYEIKIRKDSKGDKVLIVKDENTVEKMMFKDPDGKILQDKTEKRDESLKFVEETLEREGTKRATRLRRTYEKAQVTKDGTTTTLPYEGKTVLIEKKDMKYTFTIEGGKELTGEDASHLAKEFNKPESALDLETIFLPKKAVAVGETWKIDAEALAKDFTGGEKMALDTAKSTATGKLIKAYKKDAKTFGVIEVKLDFPILSIGDGAQKIGFKDGARASMTMNMDVCIDGTSHDGIGTSSMLFSGTGSIQTPDGKEFTLLIDTRTTGTDRREERSR